MKSLMESLFDKDLVQKNPGVFTGVIDCLVNFINQAESTMKDWIRCLDNIAKIIDYEPFAAWDLLGEDIPNNIKDNELYIGISYKRSDPVLLLMARHLIGDKEFSTKTCPFIVLRYSDDIKTIYSDIYRTWTYDYGKILKTYKGIFNWYRVSEQEINSFTTNVFNQIEQIF